MGRPCRGGKTSAGRMSSTTLSRRNSPNARVPPGRGTSRGRGRGPPSVSPSRLAGPEVARTVPSGPHHLAAAGRGGPGGVPRVHDQAGVLEDKVPVVGRVVGDDDDGVLGRQV